MFTGFPARIGAHMEFIVRGRRLKAFCRLIQQKHGMHKYSHTNQYHNNSFCSHLAIQSKLKLAHTETQTPSHSEIRLHARTHCHTPTHTVTHPHTLSHTHTHATHTHTHTGGSHALGSQVRKARRLTPKNEK